MSCEAIQKFMYETYNVDARQFSDKLPSHENFEWVSWRKTSLSTDLQEALVIGTEPSREYLAYMTRNGDRPPYIKYCWRSKSTLNRSVSEPHTLKQEQMDTIEFLPPFRYNADSAKATKRKFGTIIRWYFNARGLLPIAAAGDLSDWCKIFNSALKNIPSGHVTVNDKNTNAKSTPPARKKEATRGEISSASEPLSDASGEQESPSVATVEQSSDPVPVSSHGLRSTRRSRNGATTDRANETPDVQEESNVPEERGVSKLEYKELCRYLEERGEEDLLKNIHDPDSSQIQFYDDRLTAAPLSKKLFIGKILGSKTNIYAHLTVSQGIYTIDYRCVGEKLTPGDFAKVNLVHPFRHTCPNMEALKPVDQHRLDVIIIWYFIARGLTPMGKLFRYAHHFAEDLLGTLKHISASMEAKRLETLRGEPSTAPRSPSVNMGHSQKSSASDSLSGIVPLKLAKPNPAPRPSDTASAPMSSTPNAVVAPKSTSAVPQPKPTAPITTPKRTAPTSAPKPSTSTSASISTPNSSDSASVLKPTASNSASKRVVSTSTSTSAPRPSNSASTLDPSNSASVPIPVASMFASNPYVSASASTSTSTPASTPASTYTSFFASRSALSEPSDAVSAPSPSTSTSASKTFDSSSAPAAATSRLSTPQASTSTSNATSRGLKRTAQDDDAAAWRVRWERAKARKQREDANFEVYENEHRLTASLEGLDTWLSTHEKAKIACLETWKPKEATKDAELNEVRASKSRKLEELKKKLEEVKELEAMAKALEMSENKKMKEKEAMEAEKRSWVDEWEMEHDRILGERMKFDKARKEARAKADMLELDENDLIVID